MHRARQERELAAVAWLAERGLPVVAPSPLVPRAPVEGDGFSMTLWEYVDVETEGEPDYLAQAARVPRLHAVLRDQTSARREASSGPRATGLTRSRSARTGYGTERCS